MYCMYVYMDDFPSSFVLLYVQYICKWKKEKHFSKRKFNKKRERFPIGCANWNHKAKERKKKKRNETPATAAASK